MSDIFAISPSWEFTCSRLADSTIFSFHSTSNCPGYVIEISDWRLRKKLAAPEAPLADRDMDSAIQVFEELKRALGDSVFGEYNHAYASLKELSSRPVVDPAVHPLGLQVSHIEEGDPQVWKIAFTTTTEELGAARNEVRVALRRDLSSPDIAPLSIPLIALEIRDNAPYSIEKVPWREQRPPGSLQHLAKTGFESQLNAGILAVPQSGDDVWIVSRFSKCEVQIRWDRRIAVSAEFPGLNAIDKITSRLEEVQTGTRDMCAPIVKKLDTLEEYVEAIAKNDLQLRQENTELKRLQAKGFLKFIEKVRPDDFCIFVRILALGNRKAAADELGKPYRSFYDRVERWAKMGPEYRHMHELVLWRKKIGRKIMNPLAESTQSGQRSDRAENPEVIKDTLRKIQEDQADSRSYPEILRQILELVMSLSPKNIENVKSSLVAILEDELPQ